MGDSSWESVALTRTWAPAYRRVYWETPIGFYPLSLGNRVGRPTDRDAVNTAFTKIDHPYRKTYSVVSRKVWHTLCLDLQSSFFWPFSNSITEKVQPSICHFGLVNTSKATRVIFSFFSTLKTWKSKFVSKSVVNKIYLKAEHNHLLFPRWSFSWKVWSPPTKEVTLAEVQIPSPLGEMLVRLIWQHCHFQDWQLAYLYGSFQLM